MLFIPESLSPRTVQSSTLDRKGAGEVAEVHQHLAQVEEGVHQRLPQVGEEVQQAQVVEGVEVFGPQGEVGEEVYKNPPYNLHGNQVEVVGVENYHHHQGHQTHHQKNLSD